MTSSATPPATVGSQKRSASIWLNNVINWDGETPGVRRALTSAFEAEDYADCIRDLPAQGIEPRSWIESLDKVIDSLPADSSLRGQCVQNLKRACGIYGILPTSYTITPLDRPSGVQPIARGVLTDLWKFNDGRGNGAAIAVKSLCVSAQDSIEKIRKQYCKHIVVCKQAKHPNILSAEGVAPGEAFEFGIVMKWMVNGDITSYVKRYPRVSHLKLFIGVARGLNYLHNNQIVHGELTTANILIDGNCTPYLSDFGLFLVTDAFATRKSTNLSIYLRAPELVQSGKEVGNPTYKSDVYSLSMVIVEVVTGKIPDPGYLEFQFPFKMVLFDVRIPGEPRRSDAAATTQEVWKVARKCWQERAAERPEAKKVLRDLENIANSSQHTTNRTYVRAQV